jgi:aerobic-type carbon monoxide dehydrogenase small subunit (CoxS/CutS family)
MPMPERPIRLPLGRDDDGAIHKLHREPLRLAMTQLDVNGKQFQLDVDAERSLLSVLREELDLTGSKYGCGEGECGACTVLIDGAPVRSCRARVGGVGTKKITTIEGLEENGKLHPIQQAFLDAGAMQCAYCTSGMILSAYALLRKNANPSGPEIVRSMEGNICRCGAYQRIVAAVEIAAAALRKVN